MYKRMYLCKLHLQSLLVRPGLLCLLQRMYKAPRGLIALFGRSNTQTLSLGPFMGPCFF